MDTLPLTLNIPLNVPKLDAMFWMRQFTTDTMMKRYQINYPSATLYLQKTTTYDERKNLDSSSLSMMSFAITEYNLDGVKDVFKEATSWFTDENINILYGKNDEGLLMFNSDYSKLGALYVDEFSRVKTALKIVPTVVEVGVGVMVPGVVLYINQLENGVILKYQEFKRLANFILRFNFIPYMQFAMECFHHSIITGSLLTREQVQQRYEAQKQYNSNFNF